MGIELQIQSSVLGSITARAMQARLHATCFPPLASVYFDHADVAAAPIEAVAANGTVRLRVPLDVFIVRRDSVLATPNGLPAGASAPAGRAVIDVEMTVTGTKLALRCVDADLSGLGGTLGPAAKSAIINAIGSPLKTNPDLGPALRQLGMPAPASSKIELVAGVVAIRFEPAGPAAAHLFPGQEWGIFLDGISVEKLAESKVPQQLRSRITSLTLAGHWRPVGSTPHVDVDYSGKAPQVPDPFSGDIDGTLGCDFSLTSTITKSLRTTVHWSLHINLGDLVPAFVEDIVKGAVERFMDPKAFGGTPIGDHAFTLDSSLPDVPFGGARLNYDTILASPAGMTIGGLVRLPLDPGKDKLQPSVHAFGLPYLLEFCSIQAKSGSGAPTRNVPPSAVRTYGSVWLENFGTFCDYEILSPGDWMKPYVSLPTDTPDMRIAIPSVAAVGITESVRFIVRTARGVRLIDLGVPPQVTTDANGDVTNALINYIDDCLYIDAEHRIKWGEDGGLSDRTVINPPLEHPDWTTYLGRHYGIDVQLVTLSALEPGELIQFRSPDHAVQVIADRNGRAVLPVLLPVSELREAATLNRVNRRSIAGHVTVRTAVFLNQLSLPAGRQHRLVSLLPDTAVLTTEFRNHIDVHEIGLFGSTLLKREKSQAYESVGGLAQTDQSRREVSVPIKDTVPYESHEMIGNPSSASHDETALNLQPLPPYNAETPAQSRSLARINLRGIKSLIVVPGFAEAPIALALIADGSVLILDLSDGTPRVSGTFAGPIGAFDMADDWGVAASPNRLSIYRVTRAEGSRRCPGISLAADQSPRC